MASFIDHAAYWVQDLEFCLQLFERAFGMTVEKERFSPDGLREVWLTGGVQFCQTLSPQEQDGRCAHLCLITDDLDTVRACALSMGCRPGSKYHWVILPDGLQVELFQAAPGAVASLRGIRKRG